MKKKKFDVLIKIKKIKKNKLTSSLNTLNKEKNKLQEIKEYLSDTLQNNKTRVGEFSAIQLRQLSSFNNEIVKKLEVSKNRYSHINDEINNNLKQIHQIDKQKEKIISKKKTMERIEINSQESKKENYRNKISII